MRDLGTHSIAVGHSWLFTKCSRDRDQVAVFPVHTWFRRSPSKHPQPNPLLIDSNLVCEATDRSMRIRTKTRKTVQEVLGQIVGGVTNERLWINHQPRLPLRPQYIPGVQIRRQ